MKPAPFEYHAPETVDEVCGLLAEHGDEARVLAGGQSLVPMLALRLTRFGHLVDVNRVGELSGFARENGTLVVRAATRQRVMERDGAIAAAVPLLARATPLIGHFQIRNRGTVGGSLAHADPAAEYPAVALALDAEFYVTNAQGRRTVPASEFFVSTFMTALDTEDVLTGVRFPVWSGRRRQALVEPRKTLADFLREDCALTGTHLGCEHGVCGACTVLLDGEAVRACLLFAIQAGDAEVTTVEGLTPTGGGLSPVQEA